MYRSLGISPAQNLNEWVLAECQSCVGFTQNVFIGQQLVVNFTHIAA